MPLRQRLVDLLQRGDEPLAAGGERVLTRVVGAVGKPERDRVGAGLAGDLDAREQVVDRSAPNVLVRVAEAPELVRGLLKQVRVDRAESQAERGGELAQLGVVLDRVPRDVEGNRRRDAGVADEPAQRPRSSRVSFLGTPGCGNTANRVPELPNAHDGVSICWAPKRRLYALDAVTAFRERLRQQVVGGAHKATSCRTRTSPTAWTNRS